MLWQPDCLSLGVESGVCRSRTAKSVWQLQNSVMTTTVVPAERIGSRVGPDPLILEEEGAFADLRRLGCSAH